MKKVILKGPILTQELDMGNKTRFALRVIKKEGKIYIDIYHSAAFLGVRLLGYRDV